MESSRSNTIARNDSDPSAPSHLAGCSGDHLTPIIKPDPETGIGKGLNHGPLDPQDLFTLGHPGYLKGRISPAPYGQRDKPATDVRREVGVHGPR